jgi:hypothetical protein
MKDQLLKENLFNTLADIPAYAFIAYANFAQAIPTDYPAWELFMLNHGWLILLVARISVALFDLGHRIKGDTYIVNEDGKLRQRSIWSIILNNLKQWIR